MSNYGPAPHKPDSRTFASYPMPAKVNLIDDGRRRESLDEQELSKQIGGGVGHGGTFVPRIEVNSPQPSSPSPSGYASHSPINHYQQQQKHHHQQQYHQVETRQVVHQQQYSGNHANTNYPNENYQLNQQQQQQQQQQHQYQQQQQQPRQAQNFQQNSPATAAAATSQVVPVQQETRSIKTIQTSIIQNKGAVIAAELAEKEAKLMAEIEAFQQRPYSPYQVPAKIDLSNEQRKAQQQFDHAPMSPRPLSQASSTRSTSADLMDKEAKLMQYIEDIERKPYNPQTMVVEREQWFEYPQDRPGSRQLIDSKRRLNDFCSLPAHVYPNQGQHIHEENLPIGSLGRPSFAASSVHTTIIRNPRREVDNKSPLPFAFDNFTTKGVRGNIASAGAIEPDRPRAPIYPILKRTPSPNMARS